jgi:peptide/nickel transport system permease protein
MLGWLPTSGAGDFQALVLPSVALGALSMSTFARMARISIRRRISERRSNLIGAAACAFAGDEPREALTAISR